jgi:His-Xaa-Ser repeat protein HxsA
MKKARFLISSLALTGLGATDPAQAMFTTSMSSGNDDPNRAKLFKIFRQDHAFSLAGHSSHSSHASHASHASSAGGGGYYSPTPVYVPTPAPTPTPPPAPLYVTPAPSPKERAAPPPLSGRTERFTSIVRRVQLGLLAYGYYEGTIDGVVNPTMKIALRRFQGDFKLPVTGTVTPEVLDALRISTE